MKRISVLVFVCLTMFVFHSHDSAGQSSVRDSVIRMSNVSILVGGQVPAGDLSDRFGNSASLGASYGYKNSSNWTFGVEGGFIFGRNVKPPVAVNIRTADGEIIDNDGGLVEMLVQQRGFYFTGFVAKTLPIIGPNPNSGLFLKGGVGLLQHKIRLETRKNDISILEGDYIKGFDRLTNGLVLQQFVGYQHCSNNQRVNYTIGLDFMEGFTQSRRDYNFDLQRRDDQKRLDILVGIRVGWSLLLYRAAPNSVYSN